MPSAPRLMKGDATSHEIAADIEENESTVRYDLRHLKDKGDADIVDKIGRRSVWSWMGEKPEAGTAPKDETSLEDLRKHRDELREILAQTRSLIAEEEESEKKQLAEEIDELEVDIAEAQKQLDGLRG